MPIYESRGKKYNIPDERVDDFLESRNDAKLIDNTPYYLSRANSTPRDSDIQKETVQSSEKNSPRKDGRQINTKKMYFPTLDGEYTPISVHKEKEPKKTVSVGNRNNSQLHPFSEGKPLVESAGEAVENIKMSPSEELNAKLLGWLDSRGKSIDDYDGNATKEDVRKILPPEAYSWLDENKKSIETSQQGTPWGTLSSSQEYNSPKQYAALRDYYTNTEEGKKRVKDIEDLNKNLETSITTLRNKIQTLEAEREKKLEPLKWSINVDESDEISKKYHGLTFAKEMLKQQEQLKQAISDGDLDVLSQFGKETFRKGGDAIRNILTLGVSSLGENMFYKDYLDELQKRIKNGTVNEADKVAMQAMANNKAYQDANSSRGTTIAQDVASGILGSAEYMASFIGTKGIGKLATKELTNLTKGAIKKGFGKALEKGVASGTARAIANTAGALTNTADAIGRASIMSALQPQTYSTALGYASGEAGYKKNPDNTVSYTGQTDRMSLPDAIGKSWLQNTIENVSEFSGFGIERIGERLNMAMPDVVKNMFGTGKFMSGVKSTMHSVGFNGTVPQFLEEQVATGLHSIVGDGQGKWSDLTDPRNQFVTFMTVASIGSGFSLANAAGERVYKYNVNKTYENSQKDFDKLFSGNQSYNNLKNAILTGNPEQKQQALRASLADNTTSNEQKLAVANLYRTSLRKDAFDAGRQEKVSNTVSSVQKHIEENANPQMGAVVSAVVGGYDSPMQVVEGNIVHDEEGGIDRDLSDQSVTIIDADGKRVPVSIKFVESISESIPTPEAVDQAAQIVVEPLIAQYENEDVRPYEVGEVVTANAYGNGVPFTGEVTGVTEDGKYTIVGIQSGQQMIVEPRQILNQDNIQGVEDGSLIEYVNEKGEVKQGVVGSMYALRPQGMIAMEDGEAVSIENVIGLAQQQGEEETHPIEDADVPTQEANVPFIEQIPKDEKGDFLFEQAPVETTIGALGEVYNDASELLGVVDATINGINKQIDAIKSPKPSGDINKDISNKRSANQQMEEYRNRPSYWEGVRNSIQQSRPIEQRVTEQLTGEETPTIKLTEKKKEKRTTPFQKRLNAVEENVHSIYEKILFGIASGNYKFRWKDKGVNVGLAKELGFVGSEEERKARIGILSNNGYTPSSLAHYLWEENGSILPDGTTLKLDDNDIRSEIIEILNTVTSRKQALELLEKNAGITEEEYYKRQEEEYKDEIELINQFEELISEVMSQQNEEDFISLTNKAIELGATEEQISNVYTTFDFIDLIEQLQDIQDEGQASNERGDNAQVETDERKGEYLEPTEGGTESGDRSAETGGTSEQDTDNAGDGINLSPEEQRILSEASSQIDADIAKAQDELDTQKKELSSALKRLGKAQAETQGNLFDNGKKDTLFDVPADLSRQNALDNIITPIQQQIDAAQTNLDNLINGRSSRIQEALDNYRKQGDILAEIARAESETDTNPSEAQKEAGNYKKGKVSIQGLDISIEQPKGSTRSGVDENGKEWSVEMNNTYGYIRGTQGKDGDHVDVFLGDNPESKNVFVVDQVNKDGSFDEHKVMLGFNSIDEARAAYLSNYEEGWQGLGNITEVDIDTFRKWADSDTRRIKPFAEYAEISNNANNKPIWLMSEKEYTSSVKAPKQYIEIDSSVSMHQLSSMSERAKNERAKKRIEERRKANNKYISALKEWKEQVWKSYIDGKFKSNEVFDTDAFYVLSEKMENIGIDMKSPFRISRMSEEERKEYLNDVDKKVQKNNRFQSSGKFRSITPKKLQQLIELLKKTGLASDVITDKAKFYAKLNGVLIGAKMQSKPREDKSGNYIGDGSYHTEHSVYEFNDYPEITSSVDYSNTTESVYVTYRNKNNDKHVKVRFSDHENNATKLGDELDGRFASRDEILFRLGLKEREFVPNKRLSIHFRMVKKKDIEKYDEADLTIDEMYSLGAGADLSKYKGKLAKGSNYLILGDKVEEDIEATRNFLGQKGYVGKYIYKDIQFLLRPNGTVYGFVDKDNVIYLNPDEMNANTPIHEYGHLWVSNIQKNYHDLYSKAKEVFEGSEYMRQVQADPNYSNLTPEQQLDEAMARAIGDKGESEVNKSTWAKIKEWIADVWKRIGSKFGVENLTPEQIQDLTLEDITDIATSELLSGKNLSVSEKENQLSEIKSNAIANGTFMKAHNGEPSNLNEHQWLQVRTPEFKAWFGDWEKAWRIEKLRNANIVEVSGDEYKGKYELNRDSAKQFIKNNLRGEYTIKDTGEKTLLAKDGSQKVTSHSMANEAHLKSIAIIPKMIENAIFIDELANEKDNGKYNSYRYYVVGLRIGGVDYTAKLTVGVDAYGNKYYDHSLTEIEKGKLINEVGALSPTLPSTNKSALSDVKDTKLVSILQTNHSKVVDENGEPLVVYHGSPSKFTEFDLSKPILNGRGEGNGFYFIEDVNVAKEYAGKKGNVISAFLNLKNPFKGFDSLSDDQKKVYLDTKSDDEAYNKLGIDGFIIGGQIIVRSSNQIKSATDNVGTFDSNNSDIRFQANGYTNDIRNDLDSKINTRAFRIIESWVDKHLAVKKFLDTLRKNDVDIADYNDYYKQATHIDGKIDADLEQYNDKFQKPLNNAISDIEKSGASYRDIENYAILKHGIERNRWMREDAIKKYTETNPDATQEQIDKYAESLPKDYSGINEVEKEVGMSAESFVTEFEKKTGKTLIDNFWGKVKNATQYSLRKQLEGGFINKKTFDDLSGMYDYYIPLRGHDAETSEDKYDYSPNMGTYFVAPLIKAKGRKTRSESPFAYIFSMAQSSINSSNRNWLNQTMLLLANKDKTGLMGVSQAWYVVDGANKIVQYPTFSENPEQYRKNIEEFEKRMNELAKNGLAFKSGSKLDVGGLFIKRSQAKQHEIHVWQNGKEYVVYINANPAVSRAINGENTKELDNVLKLITNVNRYMAANFTTRNPIFVATNFSRDYLFSSSILPVKEDVKYALQFQRNIPRSAGALQRYIRGKADISQKEDQYVIEYIMNGAKTGFSSIMELDGIQKKIERDIKNGGKRNHFRLFLDFLQGCNEFAENLSRLSVYITSREQGRSIIQSVSDAKEVTVNFNRKGSGGYGADWFRSLFLFVNVATQALSNFVKVAKENKGKMAILVSCYSMSGFLMPFLSSLIGGDDGLEEYMKLSEWERQNNLCIYTGNGFIKIPLPQELRVFHAMGDNIYQSAFGRKDTTQSIFDVLLGFSDLIPANPMGSIQGSWAEMMPDATKPFFQLAANKNFTGARITKEWADENKPGYLRVRTNKKGEPYAPAFLVKLGEFMDSATGGDGVEKGLISFNPDEVNHVLRGYFGGLYTIGAQVATMADKVYEFTGTGELNLKVRETPLKSFFTSSDDLQTTSSGLNTKYFKIADDINETKRKIKGYKEQAKKGEIGIDKLSEKMQGMADDVERYKHIYPVMKQIEKYEKALKDLDGDQQKDAEKTISDLKKEVIEINSTMGK